MTWHRLQNGSNLGARGTLQGFTHIRSRAAICTGWFNFSAYAESTFAALATREPMTATQCRHPTLSCCKLC